MNSEPQFVSLEAVLLIHEQMIRAYGGSDAIRDGGLLESAVEMARAQFGGAYLHDGLASMAAAYLFHLCQNHPFIDGNKRTALAASQVFLRGNGHRLDVEKVALESLTLGVAAGEIRKDAVVAFFRAHVVPLA